MIKVSLLALKIYGFALRLGFSRGPKGVRYQNLIEISVASGQLIPLNITEIPSLKRRPQIPLLHTLLLFLSRHNMSTHQGSTGL